MGDNDQQVVSELILDEIEFNLQFAAWHRSLDLTNNIQLWEEIEHEIRRAVSQVGKPGYLVPNPNAIGKVVHLYLSSHSEEECVRLVRRIMRRMVSRGLLAICRRDEYVLPVTSPDRYRIFLR